MRRLALACIAALLAGCASQPRWTAETIPTVQLLPAPAPAPKAVPCPELPASIAVEARSTTAVGELPRGDLAALSAALMVSEARKNEMLARAIRAYGRCTLPHPR